MKPRGPDENSSTSKDLNIDVQKEQNLTMLGRELGQTARCVAQRETELGRFTGDDAEEATHGSIIVARADDLRQRRVQPASHRTRFRARKT